MSVLKFNSIPNVSSVAFSLGGTKVVSVTYDNKIIIWDTETGAIEKTLKGQSFRVISAAFGPDVNKIVSVFVRQ